MNLVFIARKQVNYVGIKISDQSAVGGGFFNSGNQFGNANTPNQPQKTVSSATNQAKTDSPKLSSLQQNELSVPFLDYFNSFREDDPLVPHRS